MTSGARRLYALRLAVLQLPVAWLSCSSSPVCTGVTADAGAAAAGYRHDVPKVLPYDCLKP